GGGLGQVLLEASPGIGRVVLPHERSTVAAERLLVGGRGRADGDHRGKIARMPDREQRGTGAASACDPCGPRHSVAAPASLWNIHEEPAAWSTRVRGKLRHDAGVASSMDVAAVAGPRCGK